MPRHICDPLLATPAGTDRHAHPAQDTTATGAHDGHVPVEPAELSPHEMMGHGGHGQGGMSMAAMVADMRNRFLVAAVLSIEIAALSMSGSSLLVAVNALLLKRLRLPRPPADVVPEPAVAERRATA